MQITSSSKLSVDLDLETNQLIMSQLRALIEGENNLQCWNKAINSFSRVGEYITFDINKEGVSIRVDSYGLACISDLRIA